MHLKINLTAKQAADAARRYRAMVIAGALSLAPLAANATATPGDGTVGGQTFGLGQFGGPTGSDWQTTAQGFGQSIAPELTALIPVMVVLLALFLGPKILKRMVEMGVHA